jgi:hypothetical protein
MICEPEQKLKVVVFWVDTVHRCGRKRKFRRILKMEVTWFSETLVSYHIITRYEKPEEKDVYLDVRYEVLTAVKIQV